LQAKESLDKEDMDPKYIFKELGKEALEENSQWVVVHNDRKITPSIE